MSPAGDASGPSPTASDWDSHQIQQGSPLRGLQEKVVTVCPAQSVSQGPKVIVPEQLSNEEGDRETLGFTEYLSRRVILTT